MSAATLRKDVSRTRVTTNDAKNLIASKGLMRVYAFWLSLSVLAVVAACNSDTLTASLDQPINQFQVTGAFEHLERETLSAAVQPYVGQNLFSVDIREIQTELEQLAWVKKAMISRTWPDSISVHVQEQEAIATWGHGAYLNNEGVIFTPKKVVRLNEMPMLVGPQGASQGLRLDMLHQTSLISTVLSEHGLSADQVTLNKRGSWQLGIANGPLVELGTEPNGQRLARVIKVYKSVDNDARMMIDRIDARYTNGVAVRWKELEVVSGYEYSSNPLIQ